MEGRRKGLGRQQNSGRGGGPRGRDHCKGRHDILNGVSGECAMEKTMTKHKDKRVVSVLGGKRRVTSAELIRETQLDNL